MNIIASQNQFSFFFCTNISALRPHSITPSFTRSTETRIQPQLNYSLVKISSVSSERDGKREHSMSHTHTHLLCSIVCRHPPHTFTFSDVHRKKTFCLEMLRCCEFEVKNSEQVVFFLFIRNFVFFSSIDSGNRII